MSRCGKINQLRNVDDASCEHCIASTALYNWALYQDSCLREKLLNVMERDFGSKMPDPPTCLELEQQGLRFLQECSVEQTDGFCSALASDRDGFKRDIAKIAKHFRMGSYYATQVERMLKNLISSCGEEDHITAIAESVLVDGFHSHRLVFCTVIFTDFVNIIDNSTAVQLVSQGLGKPVEQVSFSGVDHSRKCIRNYPYPGGFSPSHHDLLLFITWTPDNYSEIVDIGTEGFQVGDNIGGSDIDIVFYQYTPLRSSEDFPECGDGQRQAGEMCDMGVFNVESDYEGEPRCSYDCTPSLSWVECSTARLSSSDCWEVSCGDGVRSAGEECDDGNHVSGDGCSECRVDPDFDCTTTYNSTSVCTPFSEKAQTTDYPPATTSLPSTFHTGSAASSISQLPHVHSSGSTSSSASPVSPLTPSSPHLTEDTGELQSISSQSSVTHLHWRNLVLQVLVSVLLTWITVYSFTTR